MEKYFLNINEPCTEKWESMSTAEQGKLCNHCNKIVFDFTTATDAEIVKHFEAMKGEMFCGRFEENQLRRWIERSDIKTSNLRLYKFLISFILLGAAQVANAQTNPAEKKEATQIKLDSLFNIINTKAETNLNVCDTIKQNEKGRLGELKVGKIHLVSRNHKTEPLFIIDGVSIKQKTLKKLDPNKIIALKVLKASESQAYYGSKAVNGAIIITSNYTKKELRKMQ